MVLVRVSNVRQQLGSSANGDSLSLSQLEESALAAKLALPERAIGGTTSHRAKEERINLNDLLHALAR
jgi:hypothetical protein